MAASPENLPLRDICKEAERLTRELVDHLGKNMLPRTRSLANLVRPDSPFAETASAAPDGKPVTDMTVRDHAAALLESQAFLEERFEEVRLFYRAMDEQVRALMSPS